MIRFKKIRYKNFLSVGENAVEINLDTGGKTLIVGKNGHGKCLRSSTAVDIKFKSSDAERLFKKFIREKKV